MVYLAQHCRAGGECTVIIKILILIQQYGHEHKVCALCIVLSHKTMETNTRGSVRTPS